MEHDADVRRERPRAFRQEIKFVAYETEVNRMLHWLRLNPAGFRPEFPERIVNNVYFDTLDLSAYAENLSGVSSRAKVRYRWYGRSRYPVAGALEVKRKRGLYGWKVRYPLSQSPYTEGWDWRQIRGSLMSQLPIDGRYWLQSAVLPVLINRYTRQYFRSSDGKVRATIDVGLTTWDQRLRRIPDFDGIGDASPLVIVEFKFARGDRATAVHLLSGIPIRASRCSKYAIGVNLTEP